MITLTRNESTGEVEVYEGTNRKDYAYFSPSSYGAIESVMNTANGWMSRIRMFNEVLTTAEIAELWNDGDGI
jgi:hypothetical protein